MRRCIYRRRCFGVGPQYSILISPLQGFFGWAVLRHTTTNRRTLNAYLRSAPSPARRSKSSRAGEYLSPSNHGNPLRFIMRHCKRGGLCNSLADIAELDYWRRTPGKIVPARGPTDFGWDPVFEPDGEGLTYAELPKDRKNAISHRGRSLSLLKSYVADNAAALTALCNY